MRLGRGVKRVGNIGPAERGEACCAEGSGRGRRRVLIELGRRLGLGVQIAPVVVGVKRGVGKGGGAPVGLGRVGRRLRGEVFGLERHVPDSDGSGGGDRSRSGCRRRRPLIDAFAGFGQKAGGALLAQPHALGQFARGAIVALLDPGGAFGQALTDVVQRLLRATLGLGDALRQPFGDAGDLVAQALKRHGVAIVGGRQALLDTLGLA